MIVKSMTWCCELCGAIIKGKCNNDAGYITHIDQCISYEFGKVD